MPNFWIPERIHSSLPGHLAVPQGEANDPPGSRMFDQVVTSLSDPSPTSVAAVLEGLRHHPGPKKVWQASHQALEHPDQTTPAPPPASAPAPSSEPLAPPVPSVEASLSTSFSLLTSGAGEATAQAFSSNLISLSSLSSAVSPHPPSRWGCRLLRSMAVS